jgi:Uma2 family endonuclease
MQNLEEIIQSPKFPPPEVVDVLNDESSLGTIIEQLPPKSSLILYEQTWEDYENLLEAVGEASGLRISFDAGTLEIMTLSTEHENYAQIITRIVDRLSVRQNIEIVFFGSATIKQSRFAKGIEPDACFYVQSVEQIGRKIRLDFSVDPPPDIAVEIDLYHESLDKLPIYAALGISEIWRYAGNKFEIYKLTDGSYKLLEKSHALPVLSAEILGSLLNLSRRERQTVVLKEFESWLSDQK